MMVKCVSSAVVKMSVMVIMDFNIHSVQMIIVNYYLQFVFICHLFILNQKYSSFYWH
jgi:hypothetical protein